MPICSIIQKKKKNKKSKYYIKIIVITFNIAILRYIGQLYNIIIYILIFNIDINYLSRYRYFLPLFKTIYLLILFFV